MSKLTRIEQAGLSVSHELKMYSLTVLERAREDWFHPCNRDAWIVEFCEWLAAKQRKSAESTGVKRLRRNSSMSNRVGICKEHEVEWAIVQHCRVCNLTAERDSLKVQRDELAVALRNLLMRIDVYFKPDAPPDWEAQKEAHAALVKAGQP